MWIIVTDTRNIKRYINLENIDEFYLNGEETCICIRHSMIAVKGDITKKLMEILRMTGVGVKQIGAGE